jgi:hypothetical protein
MFCFDFSFYFWFCFYSRQVPISKKIKIGKTFYFLFTAAGIKRGSEKLETEILLMCKTCGFC